MSPLLDVVLLGFEAFVTLFLLLHDWVPLGSLNNLAGAIRREDSLLRSVWVTPLPAVPAALGLYFSALRFARPYPLWLAMLLWITYGVLLAGLLPAWWIPYLLVAEPARVARYQTIFAGTHRFLPERNGMAPDTLHTVFHGAVVGTIVLLLIR